MLRSLKNALLEHAGPVYRVLMIPVRMGAGLRYVGADLGRVLAWAIGSREDTNYTYDLTELNLHYLAHLVAVAAATPVEQCRRYVAEAAEDHELHRHIAELTRQSGNRWNSDLQPRFARRLGWYAMVRATRPRLVVETGVDKGLGSVLLCSALLKNAAEGFAGEYRGTDINPRAGWLLAGRYAACGRILYGDSITSLRDLAGPIDLFINDSDHSADYEAREYQVIAEKLSAHAIVISDNAHVSDALCRFSEQSGRDFLYLNEQPLEHWYPGAGIGVSLPRVSPPPSGDSHALARA